MSFAVLKNMHVLQVLGTIEFRNQTIIMESSFSLASNRGSPGFGPISMRWLIFPFSSQYSPNKLRSLQVVLPIRSICCVNDLQVP